MKTVDKTASQLEIILSDKKVRDVVENFRLEQKIPKDGFSNIAEYREWKISKVKKSKDDKVKYFRTIHKYFQKVKKILEPIDLLKKYDTLIFDILFYSKPRYESLIRGAPLDFRLLVIKKEEAVVGKGIYLKISPFANLTNIRSFLTRSSLKIKKNQKYFSNKIITKYNLMNTVKSNDVRDYMIYCMNLLPDEQIIELWKIDSYHHYKYELISKAIKTEGYRVTPDNVKKIIYRMSKNLN